MSQYRFYPTISRLQQGVRVLAGLALVATLLLWPASAPAWTWWLRATVGLSLLAWGLQSPPRPRAFLLDDDGTGRWLDDQTPFVLSGCCRLLPGAAVLVLESGQGPLWCFPDSHSRADWHRLCRLALAAQVREGD